MWFKRRKKSEQDHALSESLRSLQSLLSETGRTEPSLEPKNTRPDTARTESTDRAPAPPADRDARRMNPADIPEREPAAPDAGNRWRDLNLSFDAEPVVPQPRRDDEEEHEDQESAAKRDTAETASSGSTGTAPEADDQADDQADNQADNQEADPDGTVSAGPGEPVLRSDEPGDTRTGHQPVPADAAPESADGDTGYVPDAPEAGLDDALQPPAPSEPVEPAPPEPVVYYDDFTGHDDDQIEDHERSGAEDGPGAAAESGTPSYDEPDLEIDLSTPSEPDLPDPPAIDEEGERISEPDDPFEDDPVADDRVEVAANELTSTGSRQEDQLHLELDQLSDADIPILTDAVYVPESQPREIDTDPDPAADEGQNAVVDASLEAANDIAPPGPAASPHDDTIEKCIDNLRVRLQLTGLDPLSPEQEKELHDALVEFLDDMEPR